MFDYGPFHLFRPLQRCRAVDDEHRGAEIAAIVDATMATGFTMSAIAGLRAALAL